MKKYDYIICGAGCASLTFLYKLFSIQKFQNLRVLVIDNTKSKNLDKTWCFWETDNTHFKEIVHHKWNLLKFKSPNAYIELDIKPYSYNLIKGEDFENYTKKFLQNFANIEFTNENIIEIKNNFTDAVVKTSENLYQADYVFNSTLLHLKNETLVSGNSLLQHFLGYEIETDDVDFDETKATFMDFDIDQSKGACFVYILPTQKNKALIEYTFFSKNILQLEEYKKLLDKYIYQQLGISNFKVHREEFGIIPMSEHRFKPFDDRIVHIGTAAGCVKPSTGFAFKSIQEHCDKIIKLLIENKKPHIKLSYLDKKFFYYDSILLEVINKKKMPADIIFDCIFKKNKSTLVFKFLDNKTNFLEDLKIMSSVPLKIFLPVAIKKLFK